MALLALLALLYFYKSRIRPKIRFPVSKEPNVDTVVIVGDELFVTLQSFIVISIERVQTHYIP